MPIGGIITAITTVIGKVAAAVAGIGKLIGAGLVKAIGSIGAGLKGIGSLVWKGITQGIPSIAKGILNLPSLLQGGIEKLADFIAFNFKFFPAEMRAHLANLITSIGKSVMNPFSLFGQGVQKTLESIRILHRNFSLANLKKVAESLYNTKKAFDRLLVMASGRYRDVVNQYAYWIERGHISPKEIAIMYGKEIDKSYRQLSDIYYQHLRSAIGVVEREAQLISQIMTAQIIQTGGLIERFKEFILRIFGAIAETIQRIRNFLLITLNRIKDFLAGIVASMLAAFHSVFNRVLDSLAIIFKSVLSTFTSWFNIIRQKVLYFFSYIKGITIEFGKMLFRNLENILVFWRKVLSYWWQSTQNLFNRMFEFIKTHIITPIQERLQVVITTLTEFINESFVAMREFFDWFKDTFTITPEKFKSIILDSIELQREITKDLIEKYKK